MPPSRHSIEPRDPERPDVPPEDVLAFLAAQSQPLSIREIAHGMDLRHRGRRYLPRVLNKLVKRHEVEEVKGGRYRTAGAKQSQNEKAARAAKKSKSHTSAPQTGLKHEPTAVPPVHQKPERGRDPNLISGRLITHRDGYGFLVPDQPIPRVEGDLFIGREGLGDAMNGDKVLARIERRRTDGRAEGRIVQIVERQHPTVVGLFRYGPHGNVVLPYDARILHEVSIPAGAELTPQLRAQLSQLFHEGSPPEISPRA